MSGETDLDQVIASLRPERRAGEYVFVSLPDPAQVDALAVVHEAEGVTYIVPRGTADERGWPYDFIAAWITLRVHTSLAAIGVTATVTSALADDGISCNMLAGYFHDHVLVPADRADDALETLRRLSSRNRS